MIALSKAYMLVEYIFYLLNAYCDITIEKRMLYYSCIIIVEVKQDITL